MRHKLINISSDLILGKYFLISPENIRKLLEPMVGYVMLDGEIVYEKPNIEQTVQNHSGDHRIWFDGYWTIDEFQSIIVELNDKTKYCITFEDWLFRCDSYLFEQYLKIKE